MGCASSKSTPTVDSNPSNIEGLAQTLQNNGKAMVMKSQDDIMNKIDDLKNNIQDTLSIGSDRKDDCDNNETPSPPTERVQDQNDEPDSDFQMNDNLEEPNAEEESTAEHTIPITMTLNMEKMEDTMEPSEKPPTPMPEEASLSDVSVGVDDDDSKSVGTNQTNCNTLNSNIMDAICNSAAQMAMNDSEAGSVQQDSEYESISGSQVNTIDSRDSRQNQNDEEFSDYEQNKDNVVSRSSTMSISSYQPATGTSTACSTFENARKRGNGRNLQRSNDNDTYLKIGRELYSNLETKREAHGSMMPGVLKLMENTTLAEGDGTKHHKRSRTISLNGNVHFTK